MVTAPAFRAAGSAVDLSGGGSGDFDVPLPAAAQVQDVAVLVSTEALSTWTTPWPRIIQQNDSGGQSIWVKQLTASDLAAGKVSVDVAGGGRRGIHQVLCWSGSTGVESSAIGGVGASTWAVLTTSNPATVVYVATDGGGCVGFDATVAVPSPTQRSKVLNVTNRLLYVGDLASTGVSDKSGYSYTGTGAWPTPARAVLSLAPALPPDPPDLLTPAGGVNVTGEQLFTWQHRPAHSYNGPQSAYVLKFTDAGSAVTYWDAAAGARVAGETWNPGSGNGAAVSLPRGLWSWTVKTRESITGRESAYATPTQALVVDRPTVSVTAPSGIVSDPTVAWTTTSDPASTGQQGWLARVWSAEQYAWPGFDLDTTLPLAQGSGTTQSSWDPGPLSPGGYVAAVMVAQADGIWSDWDTTTFTVDAAVSGSLTAPVLSVRQGGLPSGAPATELTLTGVAGTAQVDYTDDGVTWQRAVVDLAAGGVVFDAAAPLDAARSYRARVTDGVSVSAWSATVSHALWSGETVLVDLVTGYAVPGRFVSEGTRTNPVQRDVLHAIGRSTTLVSSDVFGADTGQITVSTWTADGMDDVLSALASGLVMLRWTQERDFDGPGVRPSDDVVQVTSDIDRDRVVQNHGYRTFTFSWATQPKPVSVLWAP